MVDHSQYSVSSTDKFIHLSLVNDNIDRFLLASQGAKKVVFDSPRLVDFAIRLTSEYCSLLAQWESEVFEEFK